MSNHMIIIKESLLFGCCVDWIANKLYLCLLQVFSHVFIVFLD